MVKRPFIVFQLIVFSKGLENVGFLAEKHEWIAERTPD